MLFWEWVCIFAFSGCGHRRGGSDEVYQIKSSSPVFVNTAHIPVNPGTPFHQVSTFPGSIQTASRANNLPQRSVSHQPPAAERVQAPRHASWTSDSGGGIQIELIPPRSIPTPDIQQGIVIQILTLYHVDCKVSTMETILNYVAQTRMFGNIFSFGSKI